ncbi:MAG: hypothetical protein CVV27_17675 [Candidatus Melainabacteria bacterium HGW-Melainabacteria-1]|nr:MAG: hypothetical protein CVV27_17675 [Candidatus Melainabacteria bacterium HGW-Melainabacteria-1]
MTVRELLLEAARTFSGSDTPFLDAVILLAAGQLVYYGPPAEMLDFFECRSYEGVYKVLAKSPPGEWAGKFQSRRRT